MKALSASSVDGSINNLAAQAVAVVDDDLLLRTRFMA